VTRVVLASASSGRLSILRNAGVEPVVIVSAVDEDAVIAALSGAAPDAVVLALAEAKADDVAARPDVALGADYVVIGCDSMLLLEGELRGKPGTADAARTQWQAMAGRTGQLLTGHAVLRVIDGQVIGRVSETSSTDVSFATPERADLDAYLASGEPLGVAGSFTLDGLGGWFVDRIDGAPSNVIGLSLPLLRRLLGGLGVSVAAAWEANRLAQ
jgi:septum formation protein